MYENAKNFISVLNKAVKIAKKSKCWKTSLLPSKKFDSLKNFMLAIASNGARVPTRCTIFIPSNEESWNQTDENVIAMKTAMKILKPNKR